MTKVAILKNEEISVEILFTLSSKFQFKPKKNIASLKDGTVLNDLDNVHNDTNIFLT